MSRETTQKCPHRVKLLNDSYRATVLLSTLTDALAATDPGSSEFQSALETVRAAREAVDIARVALEVHAVQCACGNSSDVQNDAETKGGEAQCEGSPDALLN